MRPLPMRNVVAVRLKNNRAFSLAHRDVGWTPEVNQILTFPIHVDDANNAESI